MSFISPRSLKWVVVVALAIISFTPSGVLAQSDQGRITGTVTDANGGIVPGATVLVKSERTGEERTATTNEAGYYIVTALKPSL